VVVPPVPSMLVAVGLALVLDGNEVDEAGRSPSVGGGGATSLEVIDRNTTSEQKDYPGERTCKDDKTSEEKGQESEREDCGLLGENKVLHSFLKRGSSYKFYSNRMRFVYHGIFRITKSKLFCTQIAIPTATSHIIL